MTDVHYLGYEESLIDDLSTLITIYPPPFIYINDPTSPRLTSAVLSTLLTTLSTSDPGLSSPRVHHAKVNGIACFTPRLFYDTVLNALAGWTPDWEDGCANWGDGLTERWNEHFDSFLHGLKATRKYLQDRSTKGKGKEKEDTQHSGEHDDVRFVILVERAERLKENLPELVVPLTRLTELSQLDLTVIFHSDVRWEDIRPPLGASPDPYFIDIPPLPKETIAQRLSLNSPFSTSTSTTPGPYHPSLKPLYSHFISTLSDVCYPFMHDPFEIEYIAAARWPGFVQPVLDQYNQRAPEETDEMDLDNPDPTHLPPPSEDVRMRLTRLFTASFSKAMEALYPRLINAADWAAANKPEFDLLSKPHHDTRSRNTNSHEDGLGTSLPRMSKFILVAAFLASTNPAKSDVPMFGRGLDEKKRKRRPRKVAAGRTKSGPAKVPQRLLGPLAFPLDRLIAILGALLEENDADARLDRPEFVVPGEYTDMETSRVGVYASIMELTSMRLLHRTSHPDRIDGPPMYKCGISYDATLALARQLDTNNGANKIGAGICLNTFETPTSELVLLMAIVLNEGAEATLKSWSQDYVGEVPDALYGTMEAYCRKLQHEAFDKHAPFISIVQSSGMGKSRAVDELSKRHFVIPINLRSPDAKGFPPSDVEPRTFLTAPFGREEGPYQRAQAFLTALFTTTLQYLNGIDEHVAKVTRGKSKNLTTDALKFRFLMTHGQSFAQPNKFRRDFFREVIEHASELMEEIIVAKRSEEEKDKKRKNEGTQMEGEQKRLKLQIKEISTEEQETVPMENEQDAPSDEKIEDAQTEQLLDSAKALVFKLLRHTQQYTGPIAVVALDEAHVLNTRIQPEHASAYTGLRRALLVLRKQPIFTLFLSTTGKFGDLAAPLKEDPSARLLSGIPNSFPPFVELGFDQMARMKGIARKGADIEEMARPGSMAMFGRPMFGSRYLNGGEDDREDIIAFAITKLSCCSGQKDAVILACMAVRLALEFNSSTTEVQEIEKQQVEKHLRVCVLADDRFESVVTVAPSEPLLAEASRRLMLYGEYSFDLLSSLLKVLEIPGVDKGNRNGLTAGVILLKAYDSAFARQVSLRDRQARYSGTEQTRAVKLLMFIEHLLVLGNDKDGNSVDLSKIYPTKARTATEGGSSFAKTFSDSWVYFNHFIKLDDGAVINREFLWRLILRGAWVMCANSQQGADVVGAFLIKGKKIAPENVSVFAFQIKNDGTFALDPKLWLFNAMNPFWLRIFGEDTKGKPPPIIRMVFALASPEAGVSFISANERDNLYKREAKEKSALKIAKRRSPAYTTFDIWCAGASHETFKVIEKGDELKYAELLKIKKAFPAAYEKGAESDLRQSLRKEMNPAAATDTEHWRYLFEDDLPRKVDVHVSACQYEDDEMDVE